MSRGLGSVSAVLLILIAIGLPAPASGLDSCAPVDPDRSTNFGVDDIHVDLFSAGGLIDYTAADQGMTAWNSNCSGSIPSFSTGASSSVVASLYPYAGRNDGRVPSCGDGCGCATTTTQNGRVVGAAISLFDKNLYGQDCTSFRGSTIAHEFGHVLGFDNAPATCSGRIMGPPGNRQVTSADCIEADRLWFTDIEREDPNDDDHGPCGT